MKRGKLSTPCSPKDLGGYRGPASPHLSQIRPLRSISVFRRRRTHLNHNMDILLRNPHLMFSQHAGDKSAYNRPLFRIPVNIDPMQVDRGMGA